MAVFQCRGYHRSVTSAITERPLPDRHTDDGWYRPEGRRPGPPMRTVIATGRSCGWPRGRSPSTPILPARRTYGTSRPACSSNPVRAAPSCSTAATASAWRSTRTSRCAAATAVGWTANGGQPGLQVRGGHRHRPFGLPSGPGAEATAGRRRTLRLTGLPRGVRGHLSAFGAVAGEKRNENRSITFLRCVLWKAAMRQVPSGSRTKVYVWTLESSVGPGFAPV